VEFFQVVATWRQRSFGVMNIIGRPLGSENVLTELEEKMGCILRSKNPAPNVSQLKLTMVFPELPERRALRS